MILWILIRLCGILCVNAQYYNFRVTANDTKNFHKRYFGYFAKIKEYFAHYIKFICVNDHRFTMTKYFARMVENFQFQELDDIGNIWEYRSGGWAENRHLKMWHVVVLRFRFTEISVELAAFIKDVIITNTAYLLTYLLTYSIRVLLEKLTESQLVKKFPAFYGSR
jgi:hypothetical protein